MFFCKILVHFISTSELFALLHKVLASKRLQFSRFLTFFIKKYTQKLTQTQSWKRELAPKMESE